MQRYFFDVETHDRYIRDEGGIDLADETSMWSEAARLVLDSTFAPHASKQNMIEGIVVRTCSGVVAHWSINPRSMRSSE